ncbi:hypothetical protein K438DRAFT_2086030 [Mycena galopus ATCC 62051]|nr:hypothetical protein K438DRAFT_2086030 [Mycena galopus ATCC 62051]
MPARPQGQSFAEFLGIHQQDETKPPNKHTDRVAWNAHFERGIAKSFGSRTPTLRSPKNKADPTHPVREFQGFEDFNITGLNQQLAVVVRELMEKEGSLIALALDKLVYGSFEAEWEKLDSNKKEELVLEGLYRGACTAPRDDSRCVCPEMTITGLAGSGEYNLISRGSLTPDTATHILNPTHTFKIRHTSEEATHQSIFQVIRHCVTRSYRSSDTPDYKNTTARGIQGIVCVTLKNTPRHINPASATS